MSFWKNLWLNVKGLLTIRCLLIVVFFAAGMVMTISGWRMTGELAGLGIMLVGVVLLLTALFVYNKPYK